jgi:hypothetical protein
MRLFQTGIMPKKFPLRLQLGGTIPASSGNVGAICAQAEDREFVSK